ncbi:GNAT family N-acetyltransferase [Micromonospora siamensis]|uniref:Acetyltransferase (GNAT) family protein n=1 Tax=Micromonospora siamensis TaxID=299152 RepID=A0A1C5H5K7_9ACTN|nr:GNAT family N-acetyltransferase [Micromonospora siamensis]SCG41183.1 Acetyltransferase (GNAT) family protein [Micromonospora siamensis]
MTGPEETVDLAATLRALRRQADLSQRELAEKAGVPQSTVARIEAGRATDVRFRTVEQLVRAAAGRLTIALAGSAGTEPPDTRSLPLVPHEGLRDAAGRQCPPHLDAREVREPRDWPGAWWAAWGNLPPPLWPLPLPAATYRRDRRERDRRRRAEEVRRSVRIRRFTGGDLPATSWRFVAELPDGDLVGELRAHEVSVDLLLGYDLGDRREVVLDGVLVRAEARGLGIGRRLLEALRIELQRVGIVRAHAIAEFEGIGFLIACGYRVETGRPVAFSLDLEAEHR